MYQIYFATRNKGKVNSVKESLSKYNIEIIHVSLDLPEPRTDDLQKIAKEKVLFAYEQIKRPCIALDAGFYIHSLKGFPKAFVNFALETIGIEGILKLVEGKSSECEFRNCLAYIDEKSFPEPHYFESKTEGTLTETKKGKERDYYWSELFFVFIPKESNKTLAEMTIEEYKRWREERIWHSFATKFAEWISNRH